MGVDKVLKKHPRIKKNDKVTVLTGKDKGKIGTVLKVDSEKGRLVVEKVNVVKRHMKPNVKAPQGGIVEKEASIDISNVMLVCNKCAEATKLKIKILADGSKVRECKKCNEPIN